MRRTGVIRKVLLGLNFLMGLGACCGSFFAFSSLPVLKAGNEFMGLTNGMLKNAPFNSFFIPGLFLLIVLGQGNLIVGFLLLKKRFYPYFMEIVIGAIMSFWIMIQIYMLLAVNVLHVIFLLLGMLQIGLAIIVIRDEGLKIPLQAHQN